MLLAIDVGNTNITIGLYEGPKLAHHYRVATHRHSTADEHGVLLRQLLFADGIEPKRVTGAIIACVVPPLLDPVRQAVFRHFGTEVIVVEPGLKTGVPVLYENPREVGADRIVNAVAAFERVRGGVIVVDFGTATTFDCVSPKGEYLGGVIAPGISISADALFREASRLPRVELVRPKQAVGRNTVHSMQSGIVFGYVALVDGMVERLKTELGFPCKVIATGGLAPLIASESRAIETTDEFLTLDGLRILYERNARPSPG